MIRCALFFLLPLALEKAAGYVHPAGLMSVHQINRLQTLPSRHPAVTKLLNMTPIRYKPRAIPKVYVVGPDKPGGYGHDELMGDAEQTYKQALAYLVTGNKTYATNAMAILSAWANTCNSFGGGNAPLEASWATASMARGAELLKYTYPDWDPVLESQYMSWLDDNLMKHIKYNLGWFNNWSLAQLEARLQIALMRDDAEEVEWCQKAFYTNYKYIVKPWGGVNDGTRDVIHAQFSVASLIQMSELMWQQGVDLYNYKNNMTAKMVEFHASVLLGDKPEPRDKYSLKDNWFLSAGYEIALQHYGETALPRTAVLMRKKRPDGYAFCWGFDSLTHYFTAH